jgi:hypothetical protein
MTASNAQPTILSPMTKSLPWKKSAALTTMIKTSSPNKTIYVLEISLVYSPTLLQNDTSTFEP